MEVSCILMIIGAIIWLTLVCAVVKIWGAVTSLNDEEDRMKEEESRCR